MILRDRTMRIRTLVVLVASLAAITGAAGAEWSSAPARDVSAVSSHSSSKAANPSPSSTRPAALRVEPKRATPRAHRVTQLTLPPALPARMLPAGAHLPTPAAPPSDPWAQRQPTQLGRIVIPKTHLDQPFFEGVDQAAFAHGVGHWPGTAGPGGWGNAVFGGHRVTQTHPFLDNDQLRPGDEIDFVMLNGWTYVYRVTTVYVVSDSAMWIKDQKPGRTLTLFTCNPKGSATQRLITNGVLDRVVAAT
jgi:LPXTG-site transpeptidase (sortase) family protein